MTTEQIKALLVIAAINAALLIVAGVQTRLDRTNFPKISRVSR